MERPLKLFILSLFFINFAALAPAHAGALEKVNASYGAISGSMRKPGSPKRRGSMKNTAWI